MDSKFVQQIVQHPIGAFLIAIVAVLLLAMLLWWASRIWPFGAAGVHEQDLWSNASGWVQAILGSALVGASAFVAIMIATSASATARSALLESQTSNKLASPQYKL